MFSNTTLQCFYNKITDAQRSCKVKIVSYQRSLTVLFPVPLRYFFSCFQNSMSSAVVYRFRPPIYSRDVRVHSKRRHHRRRRSWSSDVNYDDWMETSLLEKRKPLLDRDKEEDKLVMTLDFYDFGSKASNTAAATTKAIQDNLERLAQAGNSFFNNNAKIWRDLRSSVALQDDARIVVALRWSTVDFLSRAILFSLVLVALGKLFFRLARKYKWGWEEGFSSQGLVRCDRSLGGREVIVSTGGVKHEGKKYTGVHFRGGPKPFNPLDGVEPSRSEKELSVSKHLAEGTISRQLPSWWPSHELPISQPNLKAQTEANEAVQAIMKKRLSGTDFSEEDVLKIRQTCRHSGAKVSFGSSNTRDAFYGAAIDLVLTACSRSMSGSSPPLICRENAIDFITGLGTDIGLDPEKAATVINAAVAARTHSCFLQAWALSLQGRFPEARNEIVQLVQIHSVFCPEINSPELEMVARGLETYLGVDERKELLQIYKEVGSSGLEGVAKEALGIV